VRTALENVAAHPYSDTTLLLYLMTLTNVAFDVQLLIASIFLWKLQRRGLFLLVYTLLAETFYFVGIVAVETHFKL
jgi:hypothetical protein